MSTQGNKTCSKNVAYVTMKEANVNDSRASFAASNVVYDKISPIKIIKYLLSDFLTLCYFYFNPVLCDL